MLDQKQLRKTLTNIDDRGYKNYKQIKGAWEFPEFTMYIDHIQGDPFSHPSKIRIRVPKCFARIPADLWLNSVRQVALEDFIARAVSQNIRKSVPLKKGSGKSGLIFIDAGRQEIMQRTAVVITKNWLEARMQVGLPAVGRSILGNQAITMLCQEIPQIVKQALMWDNLDQVHCREFVECMENQEAIRQQLDMLNLVAFVANGAVLPRESGISARPLTGDHVINFQTPESLKITVDLPNLLPGGITKIKGMGIPKGVTLIVGGGYHGKSTLLKALEKCVYAHIPGDGREYVITTRDAVKIRAEDGRRIENVNINPFITNLPQQISTNSFCSVDASGSTSQAANIIEALEIGANLLLLDEDTSATNFMVRDARMQKLVHKDQEPITPFVDRVRELYDKMNVSTILVMGGSGDYFDKTDTVIQMQDFHPYDVSEKVKKLVNENPSIRKVESSKPFGNIPPRTPIPRSFNASKGRHEIKIEARNSNTLLYGSEVIDLRFLDQLAERSQTRAVGHAIYLSVQSLMKDTTTLRDIVGRLEEFFDQNGLDGLDPFHKGENHPGNFSRPRKFEIAAVINRMRNAELIQTD